MPRQRISFIDWSPDLDEFNTQGLQVAENVLHEPEGYKPLHLITTGSFVADIAAVDNSEAIVTKSIFSDRQKISCWLTTTNTLNFGIDGTLSLWNTTGLPSTFSTTGSNRSVDAFDATTFEDYVFAVGMSIQNAGGGGTATILNIGYAQITLA